MVASDRALRLPIMDDGVQKFMRAAADAFPDLSTMTAQQARAFLAGRRLAVTNLGDVASADDRTIAGQGGDVPVRIYRPYGDSA
jgi:acetyl esterase